MDILNSISVHHKEWVQIVKSFGEYNYSEDLVQEMYLRLHRYGNKEKLIVNNKVNKAYIWYILKNIHTDYCKQKNLIKKVEINQDIINQSEEQQSLKHREIIESKIEKEICSWGFYEQELFNIYRSTGKSYRQLSKETDIDTWSIHRTIKACKDRLSKMIKEDVKNYNTENYELIKQ